MTEASPGSLAAAIEQASGLLADDPEGAARRAEAILRMAPADPRAALILASARRRLGDPAGARALLEPLAKAYPGAALTAYELGLVLAAQGESEPALAALRRAVTLKPDLADAWRALGDQLFLLGDTAGAEAAFAEHLRASVREPALKAAADHLFHGRLEAAEQNLGGRLSDYPDDAVALHMLAEARLRRGRDGEAETLLARAVEIDPTFDGARFDYASVLFRRQKGAEAMAELEPLLRREPNTAAYRNLMAACLALTGEHEQAIAGYRALLEVFEGQPKIWLNLGHALRTVRRPAEAAAAYKRAIELAPGLGEAYWSLANLKVAAFTPAEEGAMTSQLAAPGLTREDRLHLHFALGKALEDRGQAQEAFAHYAAGARLRRQDETYEAETETALSRRSMRLFTKAFFADRAGVGAASDAPIFIVGLPRSGSTLVEQILASHSAVEGTMELPDIGYLAGALKGYPQALTALDPAALAALGEAYLERTAIHRKLGRPHFIDKMPNNFHHVGFIHLILPGARIIDVRRHPMGACFSAFKQLFARGQGFTYDLADLGRYYRDYVALMAHFDQVLPGRVHRVIYEDLVEDTEAVVRRLLEHCGLPYEAACLEFHKNDRPVRTVSSEQVRQPIYRGGLDQWRSYSAKLAPLKAALGPALETWRG
ncbi:MAG TPA: sulfotransferase [Caulobacteraceae bacterium]